MVNRWLTRTVTWGQVNFMTSNYKSMGEISTSCLLPTWLNMFRNIRLLLKIRAKKVICDLSKLFKSSEITWGRQQFLCKNVRLYDNKDSKVIPLWLSHRNVSSDISYNLFRSLISGCQITICQSTIKVYFIQRAFIRETQWHKDQTFSFAESKVIVLKTIFMKNVFLPFTTSGDQIFDLTLNLRTSCGENFANCFPVYFPPFWLVYVGPKILQYLSKKMSKSRKFDLLPLVTSFWPLMIPAEDGA